MYVGSLAVKRCSGKTDDVRLGAVTSKKEG